MTHDELQRKRQSLHDLVEKYTKDFPARYSGPASKARDTAGGATVLISGTTGAFGSNILAIFAQAPQVEKVYAISRPSKSGPHVFERHAKALIREGYSVDLLTGGKVELIEGDLHLKSFGLEHELYEKLVDTVTHIIHNGWKVNLNAPISEFADNILSVRKLVDFCLLTRARPNRPAKLTFISSNGVTRNAHPIDPNRWYAESSLAEPDSALGSGYSEAKWVCEHILDEAARQTPLKPTAARLTQIIGGPSGYWNEKEWFPALIKSSMYLKRLPSVPGAFDFIRSDDAARVLLDTLNAEVPYLHLCHPNPILELDFIEIWSSMLSIRVMHIDDWMVALEAEHKTALEAAKTAEPDDFKKQREIMKAHYKVNPAARLMPFFRDEQESCRGKPLRGGVATVWSALLETKVTVSESRVLADLRENQVGERDIERWLKKWIDVGYLERPRVAKALL